MEFVLGLVYLHLTSIQHLGRAQTREGFGAVKQEQGQVFLVAGGPIFDCGNVGGGVN